MLLLPPDPLLFLSPERYYVSNKAELKDITTEHSVS
jgi:hypothetical protein